LFGVVPSARLPAPRDTARSPPDAAGRAGADRGAEPPLDERGDAVWPPLEDAVCVRWPLSLKLTRCSGADARNERSPTLIDGDDTDDADGELTLVELTDETALLAAILPPPPPEDTAPPPPPRSPPPAPGSGLCARAGPAVNRMPATTTMPSLKLGAFMRLSQGPFCNRIAMGGTRKHGGDPPSSWAMSSVPGAIVPSSLDTLGF